MRGRYPDLPSCPLPLIDADTGIDYAVALAADPAIATWRESRSGVSLSHGDDRGTVYASLGGHRVSVALDVRAELAPELMRR